MAKRKISAKEVFISYLISHHKEELRSILEEDEQIHYAVEINFLALSEEHMEVAESVLASPVKMLALFDVALVKALLQIYEEKFVHENFTMKSKVHVRLTGLPRYPEIYRHTVPHTIDVGRILCITGTVVRTISPKMLEYQREYMCLKCKHIFTVKADYTLHYHIIKPPRCPNPTTCYSSNFSLHDSLQKFSHTKDYQEIKIQEQAQKLLVGNIPRSIWVTLEDDLVDCAKPGDDVLICGIVLQRWDAVTKGSRPSIDLAIKANNICVNNKQRSGNVVTNEMKEEFNTFWLQFKHDPLEGRNVILSSFCPQVYGLYLVKLAVATIIAGGVQKVDPNGTRTRGESHLLLVGDPGTGKSQFLKYVSYLVPRCVLTTGIGTTSAGLTVAAVREEGEWALEAGALVLSDGGVCCIDEFNSIREVDRAAIHEAMEQQTISVAKAGIVCKLNTRCSILAATNPKGRYDVNESLNVNVALASPLLSRFDLILVLLDSRNPEWDKFVSNYILDGRDPLSSGAKDIDQLLWTMEHLQSYFCHIRSFQPKLNQEAHSILTKYYQLQRRTDGRSQARTTIRLLESLVRLSQGHARLLMKEEVTTMDAIVAVTLVEVSMCGTALFKDGNALHTAFPISPREEYRKQMSVILEKLGLHNILTKEIDRLNQEEKQLALSVFQNNINFKIKNRINAETSVMKPKLFSRGIVQTQNVRPFSNIIEMNESFEEDSEPEEGKGKTEKRRRTKSKLHSNKRLKKNLEKTDQNTGDFVSKETKLIDVANLSETEIQHDVSIQLESNLRSPSISPTISRKYFKVSDLKNYKSKVNRNFNHDEIKTFCHKVQDDTIHEMNSNYHKNREVSSDYTPSPLTNHLSDQFDSDFEDFEERNRRISFINKTAKSSKKIGKENIDKEYIIPKEKSNVSVNEYIQSGIIDGNKKQKLDESTENVDHKFEDVNRSEYSSGSSSKKTVDSKSKVIKLLSEKFSYTKNKVNSFKHSETESNATSIDQNEEIIKSDQKSISDSPVFTRATTTTKPSFVEELAKFKFNSNKLEREEEKQYSGNVNEIEQSQKSNSVSFSVFSSNTNKNLEQSRSNSQFSCYKISSQNVYSSLSSQGIQNSIDKNKVISIFDHIDDDIDFDF